MSHTRDTRGWKIEAHSAGATYEQRFKSIDVDADDDGLNVLIEENMGYESASCCCRIPIDILTEVLRQAGFTLTPTNDGETQG